MHTRIIADKYADRFHDAQHHFGDAYEREAEMPEYFQLLCQRGADRIDVLVRDDAPTQGSGLTQGSARYFRIVASLPSSSWPLARSHPYDEGLPASSSTFTFSRRCPEDPHLSDTDHIVKAKYDFQSASPLRRR